ncbi:MAG: hypothetical protein P9M06_07530 [Candidatus Saelkia tenebricola]|nr:hypothetical protein [Candidatus Saelkia tenebricola]
MQTTKSIYQCILIATLYILLIISFCLPFRLLFPPNILGTHIDLDALCWDQWFTKKCITELNFSQLWHTDFIAYPHGTNLFLDHGPPFWECISIPFQLILPFPSSHTFLVIFILLLNAFSFFILAKYLYKHIPLAFLAGILGSINPYTIYHINAGRPQQIAIFWAPLFMLYLLKTKQQPNIKNTIITSVILILTALSYWYYSMFLIIFMILFLFYSYFLHATKREKLILTKNICLVLFFFGLSILLLFGYPVIVKGLYPQGYSAIRPFPSFQEIVSKNTSVCFSHMLLCTSFGAYYPLLLILIINIISFLNLKFFKKNILWITAADLFYILSLGPYVGIFNKIIPSPLFMACYYLPTFSRFWWPINYFILSTTCSIVIIISFIYDLSHYKRLRTIVSIFLSFSYLVLFYNIQYNSPPSLQPLPPSKHPKFNFSSLKIPQLRIGFRFSRLRVPHPVYIYLKDQENGAVIELPFELEKVLFLNNQRTHKKNTFNHPGYGHDEESLLWPEEQIQLLKNNLFLRYVDEVCKHYSRTTAKKITPRQYTPQGIKKALEELHNLGFNYIVVNPAYTSRYFEENSLLENLVKFLPAPFKEYPDNLKLYRIDNLIEVN